VPRRPASSRKCSPKSRPTRSIDERRQRRGAQRRPLREAHQHQGRGQIFRVDVDTIEKIDAAGDYMCIYTGDNTLILRETMKDLEKRLDPRRFQRVHRSCIVNLDLVRQVKPHTNGECFLVLDSGSQVKVSRSYRDVVARFVH
jgi:DNA-binding LytR/AlgR family response regulator